MVKLGPTPGGGLSSDNEEETEFPVFLSRYKHIGQSHKSNKSCVSTLKISKEYGPLIFLQSSKKNHLKKKRSPLQFLRSSKKI